MRVLWITPVQMPAVTGSGSMTGGGWLEGHRLALEEFTPDLELGIASWGYEAHAPVAAGNATYYSLVTDERGGRVASMAANWRHQVVPDSAIGEAVRVARAFAPDVVHVHGTENFLGLAAIGMECPVVATIQGLASAWERFVLLPLSGSDLIRSTVSRGFLEGRGFLHDHWQMKRRGVAERRIIGRLHNFIGHNEWDRMVLGLLNPKARYFHCGHVLQSVYYEATWAPAADDHVTVFCASSSPSYKGLETLIDALHLLHGAGHREARVRIAGQVEGTPMWEVLRRRVRRFGLGGSIEWLGPLAAGDVVAELSKASFYVLPSHIENEPNSLLEAMLAGVPCIAAAVGGVPWIVRDGVDGLLYHDSDPFSLAGVMQRLVREPQLGPALGAQARASAALRCDPRTIALRTSEIYGEVVRAT